MRKGFLAALTVLLAVHAWAFAQQDGSSSIGHPPPVARTWPTAPPASANAPAKGDPSLSPGNLSEIAPAHCDGDTQAQAFGLWGSGEYLLWWFKNGRIPPLVTAGGDGVLGSPATRVLVDNLDFDNDVRQGGRFALGYQFESIPCFSVEANYSLAVRVPPTCLTVPSL